MLINYCIVELNINATNLVKVIFKVIKIRHPWMIMVGIYPKIKHIITAKFFYL